MPSLLLVEDDPAIAEPLARALTRDGYDVRSTASGLEAVELARSVDLVLLDLNLPDLDGLEVCRRIRAQAPALPVVMLTARAEEVDLVVGFDAGADDYVAKPFSLAELLARVRARLRLATPSPVAPVEVRGVRVDVEAHRAWHDGAELDLTPKEFDLLALLVAEAGRVVARTRIMRDLWDEHWYGPTRTLDMHISSLRKKLADDPEHPLITTVRGVGFRFEA